MKLALTALIAFFLISNTAHSQRRFNDSIMALRITDSLVGKVKLYYSPGQKLRAKAFHSLFTDATQYYENRYHTKFNYRVAVLDSMQWIKERAPFGFLAYDANWIFLPAKVGTSFFLSVYGIADDTIGFRSFLKKNRFTAQQVSDDVYFAYSLHELGHYFTIDNKQVIIPDMFANEMIATYISYCYLKLTKNPALQTLISFSSFIKTAYKPQYRHISAMDTLYTTRLMQNFKWFHCNIVLLCQQIYDKQGIGFLDYYLQTFRPGTPNHFTTQQVIDMLDKKCNGIVNAWATDMAKDN